jgi:putative transcriptional regulator
MKKAAFRELLTSVKQAGQIRRGERKPSRVGTFRPEAVKAVRARLGQTQEQFALMIGVSVATLRNWEQGRRHPEGPALALLRVAAKNPEAVAAALHRGPRRTAA